MVAVVVATAVVVGAVGSAVGAVVLVVGDSGSFGAVVTAVAVVVEAAGWGEVVSVFDGDAMIRQMRTVVIPIATAGTTHPRFGGGSM